MKTIFGLDLGVVSVGWAVIKEREQIEEQTRIEGAGVRISSLDGSVVSAYKRGESIGTNVARTQKRGMRRNLQRYKLRRKNLRECLLRYGWIKPDTFLNEVGQTRFYTYEQRAKATTERISLEDMARVLLMINKKRGYKSNRKDNTTEDKKQSAYLESIKEKSNTLKQQTLTIGQYLWNIIEQSGHNRLRGLVFYRKEYLNELETIWKKQAEFNPEEFTATRYKEIEQIIFYQRELKSCKELIAHCELEQEICTTKGADGKEIHYTKAPKVCPKSSPIYQEFKIWQRLNDVVLFQKDEIRPWKSVRALRERLQTPEDWEDARVRPLTDEEKKLLFDKLSFVKELKQEAVLTSLFGKVHHWNMNFEKLEGNITLAQLYSKYKAAYVEIEKKQPKGKTDVEKYKMLYDYFKKEDNPLYRNTFYFDSTLEGKAFEKQAFYRLWHLLYSYTADNSLSGQQSLIDKLETTFGFPKLLAEELSTIHFPDGYASLSTKAIRKILPFMKQGQQYSEACESAGYRHSARSLTKAEIAEKTYVPSLELLKRNSLRNPVAEKMLNQMIHVVNQLTATYGRPDEIRVEMARELKKNADERKNLSKAIVKNEKDRQRIVQILEKNYHIQNVKNSQIEKYRLWEELKDNGYKTLYSDQYVDIYDLLKTEGGSKYNVEHIIPRSVLFDNSFHNKTIELRSVNEQKGNETAYDYMRGKGANALDCYIQRVKDLYAKMAISGKKKDYLLMSAEELPQDFLARDLKMTQYIAREAVKRLENLAPRVMATTGSITGALRDRWGLIDIMAQVHRGEEVLSNVEQEEDGKGGKRIDHRHHVLDALVVAFTKPAIVQHYNTLSSHARGEKNYITESVLGIPISNLNKDSFRALIKDELRKILISNKANNKVLTSHINKAKPYVDVQKDKLQQTWTIRGALHDETIYGQIKNPERTGEKIFTIRKEVNKDFKAEYIDRVVDAAARKVLRERLATFGGDTNQAFANLEEQPIWLSQEKGIAIKKVTLQVTDKPIPLRLQRDVHGQVIKDKEGNPQFTHFANTNNNHHVAFYRTPSGKVEERMVSFYEAAKRGIAGLPIIDRDYRKADGYEFLFTLKKNEYVVFPSMEGEPAFDPRTIDLTDVANVEKISPYLFRVQKISSCYYVFRHHADTSTETEKKFQNITWKRIQSLSNKEFLGLVKVRLNHIGRIVAVGEE